MCKSRNCGFKSEFNSSSSRAWLMLFSNSSGSEPPGLMIFVATICKWERNSNWVFRCMTMCSEVNKYLFCFGQISFKTVSLFHCLLFASQSTKSNLLCACAYVHIGRCVHRWWDLTSHLLRENHWHCFRGRFNSPMERTFNEQFQNFQKLACNAVYSTRILLIEGRAINPACHLILSFLSHVHTAHIHVTHTTHICMANCRIRRTNSNRKF